jgi:sulfur carrier protein
MIQVSINNAVYQVEQKQSLVNLLSDIGINTVGCAIAVDGVIVPRTQWNEFSINEGMSITLFQAIAGG